MWLAGKYIADDSSREVCVQGPLRPILISNPLSRAEVALSSEIVEQDEFSPTRIRWTEVQATLPAPPQVSSCPSYSSCRDVAEQPATFRT